MKVYTVVFFVLLQSVDALYSSQSPRQHYTEIRFRPIGTLKDRADIMVITAGSGDPRDTREDVVGSRGLQRELFRLMADGRYGGLPKDATGQDWHGGIKSEIVEFIPRVFTGHYTVYVGQKREKAFIVGIDTKKKPGPLLVEFDCPSDCSATVKSVRKLVTLPRVMAAAPGERVCIDHYKSQASVAQRIEATLRGLGYQVRTSEASDGASYATGVFATSKEASLRPLCAEHLRLIYRAIKISDYPEMLPPTYDFFPDPCDFQVSLLWFNP